MPTIKANFTTVNYNVRGSNPSWIVIHNTANGTSAEGTAYNNTQYFKYTYREASAHYFIDDGDTVWQCVSERDTAWHCGDNASRNGCYNTNSIGIEVCEPANGIFTDKEKDTLRWLVTDIMERYNIPASRVCRHNDVTGKNCPWYYAMHDAAWEELKDYITGGDMITDSDVERIAKRCAALVDQSVSEVDDRHKAVWGIDGKGTGKSYANRFNTMYWDYDNIVHIKKQQDEMEKKIEAISTSSVDYNKLNELIVNAVNNAIEHIKLEVE